LDFWLEIHRLTSSSTRSLNWRRFVIEEQLLSGLVDLFL